MVTALMSLIVPSTTVHGGPKSGDLPRAIRRANHHTKAVPILVEIYSPHENLPAHNLYIKTRQNRFGLLGV